MRYALRLIHYAAGIIDKPDEAAAAHNFTYNKKLNNRYALRLIHYTAGITHNPAAAAAHNFSYN